MSHSRFSFHRSFAALLAFAPALAVLFLLSPSFAQAEHAHSPAAVPVATLNNGVADWTATGENTGDQFGGSVATSGDVNADGYMDVILGAGNYSGARGRVYLYLGNSSGLSVTPTLTLTGENTNDHFGDVVASAGDVNGDGYADVIVGAYSYPNGTSRGRVYMYLGNAGGLNATPALTLTGAIGDWLGSYVATAGNVNGDNYTDVIVGAIGYPNNNRQGRAYVYLGSVSGLSATPVLTLTGENNDDNFGTRVATAGDINGDGYADFLSTASDYPGPLHKGRVYVYLGGAGSLSMTPALTLTGANNGDNFGSSATTAGDVNGDGYADVVVGYHPRKKG